MPRYMDIKENKLTDKVAKEAIQLVSNSKLESFAVLGSKIRELTELSWISKISKNYEKSRPGSYIHIFPIRTRARILVSRETNKMS